VYIWLYGRGKVWFIHLARGELWREYVFFDTTSTQLGRELSYEWVVRYRDVVDELCDGGIQGYWSSRDEWNSIEYIFATLRGC
jgi:hypothetical protein